MMDVCLQQTNERLGEQGYSDVTDSEFRWRMNRALTNLRIEDSRDVLAPCLLATDIFLDKNKPSRVRGTIPDAAANTMLAASEPPRRLPYDPARD